MSLNFYTIRRTILSLLLITPLVFIPEFFIYPGFFETKLSINPYQILNGVFVVLLVLRILQLLPITDRISKVYWLVIAPVTLVSAIAMRLAEQFIFTNITFSYLHIHPEPFADFALYTALFLFVYVKPETIRQYWKPSLFTGAFTTFSLFVFLNWRQFEIFNELDKEDSPLEYATFIFFLLAALSAWRLLIKVRGAHLNERLKSVWVALLAISAIGLLVISGEEISWGQRILNIPTPEPLLEINQQEELNLHNTTGVFKYVYHAYLVLGIYGVLSWLVEYSNVNILGLKLSVIFRPFISRWFLIPYFIPMIVYVIWRFATMDGTYDPWEEVSEVYLAFGVFLIFYLSFKNTKKLLELGGKNKS